MNSASEDIIKGLIKEALVKAVIKKLVTAIPMFGMPVLNPLTIYLVGKLFEIVYDEVALITALTMIDITINRERDAYKKASDELKKQLESNDESAKQKAKEEFQRRLHDLIKFPSP